MEEFVYLPVDAVYDFLSKDGKGARTKDYEFVAAIATALFCQKQWKTVCELGFPLSPKASAELEKKGVADLSRLVSILRNGLTTDSPVDFAVRSTSIPSGDLQRKGMYVQCKRFGLGQSDKSTKGLADFINGLVYQKMGIALLVIVEVNESIEPIALEKMIDKEAFPFNRLLLLGMSKGKISFVSLFPETGMEDYDFATFF